MRRALDKVRSVCAFPKGTKQPQRTYRMNLGSSMREACDRMARRALRNIQLAAKSQYTEMDLLNRDVLPRVGEKRSRV